jgi:hypothetical protein
VKKRRRDKMAKMEKVQPHCEVCRQPLIKDDLVYTDTMFTKIQHAAYLMYRNEFIKDKGTYEKIVNKYPDYKKAFIVE